MSVSSINSSLSSLLTPNPNASKSRMITDVPTVFYPQNTNPGIDPTTKYDASITIKTYTPAPKLPPIVELPETTKHTAIFTKEDGAIHVSASTEFADGTSTSRESTITKKDDGSISAEGSLTRRNGSVVNYAATRGRIGLPDPLPAPLPASAPGELIEDYAPVDLTT